MLQKKEFEKFATDEKYHRTDCTRGFSRTDEVNPRCRDYKIHVAKGMAVIFTIMAFFVFIFDFL